MGVDSCLFCDIVDPTFSIPVETSVLQKAHAFNFNGTVIAHDLALAPDLINMVYAENRYIYLYDLDWMRVDNLHFSQLQETLLNQGIDLIARSDSHYKLISDLFKKPKHIMKYWDVDILKELD